MLGEQAGLLWTWWEGDALPPLAPLPDFTLTSSVDEDISAIALEISDAEKQELIQRGHHPYLARLGTQTVAYGWSASGQARFGGGLVTFQVPARNRYLYDFVTLPAWRGQGIYPRLLQAILRRESRAYERFWIIHQSTNIASERGIGKAGFTVACKVYFQHDKDLALVPAAGASERARAGAALLGLPLIEDVD